MRKPKEKIKVDKKFVLMGQYGEEYNGLCVPSDDEEQIFVHWEKYSSAIRQFMIFFSEMEEQLNMALAKIINDRGYEPGFRIIKYLNFRKKVSLLNDEYKIYITHCCKDKSKPKYLIELNIIYKKICELSEFRNKVAHANWITLDKDGYVICNFDESKEGVGIDYEKVKMTPGVLIKFVRQIKSITYKLSDFPDRVWENSK